MEMEFLMISLMFLNQLFGTATGLSPIQLKIDYRKNSKYPSLLL